MLYIGEVKNGKLPYKLSQEIGKYIATLCDCNVMIEIKKWSKRSIQQNNYYRSLLTMVGNELWYLPDEMHDVFKYMFLSERVEYERIGWSIIASKSTSELSTKEFTDYIEAIIRWCAGEGIICPDPTEYLYQSYHKKNGHSETLEKDQE